MKVTGPISTLPGARHSFPKGTMCDLHPDRPAIARVQGETDSFGAELNDMCRGCLDKKRKYLRTADTSGTCEWCKQHAGKLFDRRDMDEGMYGRVYRVCRPCIDKDEARIREELDRYDAEFDYGDEP